MNTAFAHGIALPLLVLVALATPGAQAGEASPAAEPDAERATALTAQVVLKVVHPDRARADLLQSVKELGGFPVLVTEHELTVKVPPDRIGAAIEAVAARGLVIEKTLSREDLTQSIAQLGARLRSKREIFQRLRRFIDDSDVAATLQIERQMTALVAELEQVKGQLRVEQERARWAVVNVSFRFRERDRIVYVRSPFDWLNSVDLDRFVREF